MSQTTYYKPETPNQAARSMTVNDGAGVVEAMEKDDWSRKKPKGWKAPVTIAADDDMLEEALSMNEQLTAQVEDLLTQVKDLTAEKEDLKTQVADLSEPKTSEETLIGGKTDPKNDE